MKQGDVTIEGGYVSVQGKVSARDVQRARKAFAALFLAHPVILVRGFFPAGSFRGDPLRDLVIQKALPVFLVGTRDLTVDLGKERIQVDLSKAVNVEVLLKMPKE